MKKFLMLCCLVSLLAVVSCGGSSGGSSSNVDTSQDFSATINETGGTIEVTDTNSPIYGTKVEVPSGAVGQNENVKISISYQDNLPMEFGNESVKDVSKVILLTKDNIANFLKPVTVTIPYDDNGLEPGDIPGVYHFDSYYNRYVAAGVNEIDTSGKTITFTTVHFSPFVAIGVIGIGSALIGTDTGFIPENDGFFHPNFGAYDHPGGSCLGMANFSQWFYTFKRDSDDSDLYFKYREGDYYSWQDDVVARELISRAFNSASQRWASINSLANYFLGETNTGLLLLNALTITDMPQTLLFTGQETDPNTNKRTKWGHAVTVYKFESGKFYLYDNNFPGEIVTVNWDPIFGFNNYSKEAAYVSQNGSFTKWGFEAIGNIFEYKEFEEIYSGAENGWASSKFVTIDVTTPALDSDDTAVVLNPNNVDIRGTISAGIMQATHIFYSLNGGGDWESFEEIDAATGEFQFNVSNLPNPINIITFIATNDVRDFLRNIPSSYAGFKQITVKIQGAGFFTNAGFENGGFTGWTHETHTWQNSTPGSYIPEKIEISTTGTDPHIPLIQKVYFGNYSVRVNSSDGNYHISSVSQTAVVPQMNNPTLEFYWAAVLEDPQHPSQYQPYIDIEVINETTGSTLYYKHFYTNDPSYSGWIDYGYWKGINWQKVIIPLGHSIGDTITLKVLSADCGYGGHGGYVYLDGVE